MSCLSKNITFSFFSFWSIDFITRRVSCRSPNLTCTPGIVYVRGYRGGWEGGLNVVIMVFLIICLLLSFYSRILLELALFLLFKYIRSRSVSTSKNLRLWVDWVSSQEIAKSVSSALRAQRFLYTSGEELGAYSSTKFYASIHASARASLEKENSYDWFCCESCLKKNCVFSRRNPLIVGLKRALF